MEGGIGTILRFKYPHIRVTGGNLGGLGPVLEEVFGHAATCGRVGLSSVIGVWGGVGESHGGDSVFQCDGLGAGISWSSASLGATGPR